jgi:hypothetical protein
VAASAPATAHASSSAATTSGGAMVVGLPVMSDPLPAAGGGGMTGGLGGVTRGGGGPGGTRAGVRLLPPRASAAGGTGAAAGSVANARGVRRCGRAIPDPVRAGRRPAGARLPRPGSPWSALLTAAAGEAWARPGALTELGAGLRGWT